MNLYRIRAKKPRESKIQTTAGAHPIRQSLTSYQSTRKL